MDHPHPLPHGKGPLPPTGKLSVLEPRAEGAIFHLMYYLEKVANHHLTTVVEREGIQQHSAEAARELVKARYNVDIGADSIDTYYREAKANAETAVNSWDDIAAAQFLSGVVDNARECDEVTFLPASY